MGFKRILALSVLSLLLVSQGAWAAVRWSLYGGVNKSLNDAATITTTVVGVGDITTTVEGVLGYGGGLSAEFSMGNVLGLELGAFYQSIGVKSTTAGVSATTQNGHLAFPAMFRIWMGRVISLGAGGYFSSSLESGGTTDYGALGSLRFSFPMGGSAFLLDGRYAHGLKDFSGTKNKGWEAFVGIMFGMKK